MEKEIIGMKGVLNIDVYEKGELVKTIKDENTIVDDGFEIISACMTGDNTQKISKIAIGDGGILASVVKTVGLSDHDLYHRVKEVAVDSNVTLSTKTISYSAYVIFEAGDNFLISEAGLFNADEVMFNRKCFAEFGVNEHFHLNIKWDIIFSFNV